MKSLFICHTVYHVYIAMVKQLKENGQNIDILLVDTILDVDNLADDIRRVNVFNNIHVLRREDIFGAEIHEYIRNYIICKLHHKAIMCKLNYLREYNDIFIFNDYTEIGALFIFENIPYHLLEDGLDTFKQFDVYKEIGKGYFFKKIAYALFKIPFSVGMGKNCIDVEVNDDKNLKTNIRQPIIVCNRENLINSLSKVDREKIVRAFDVKKIDLSSSKILILTQVLSEITCIRTDNQQVEFYKKLINECKKKYDVYLKPHPRDRIDYSSVIDNDHVFLLQRNIPMEVYRYLPGMNFEYVITYSSTAANSSGLADHVIRLDGKVSLGQ